MPTPHLDPSLKLTFCPRCDYSLQGLPDTGICPECGDAYTQDFIVLRGRPVITGDELNGQKHTQPFSMFASVLSCFAIAVFSSGTPIAILIPLAAVFCWGIFDPLLILLSAVRKNEVLVWLAPAGIGEQAYIDPESLAGRYVSASRTMWRISRAPILVGINVAVFTQHFIASTIICVVLYIPAYILDRGRRPRVVLRSAGVRPALLGWSRYGAIEFEHLGQGRYQLWARKLNSTRIRKMDVIKIDFSASADAVAQLFQLVQQWAGPSVPVKLNPVDRSPTAVRARAAGRLVGRIIRRG